MKSIKVLCQLGFAILPLSTPGFASIDEVAKTTHTLSRQVLGSALAASINSSKKAESNIFFSPLSASLAFSMLYHGAFGSSQAALANVVSNPTQTKSDLVRSQRELMNALNCNQCGVSFKTASGLFADKKQFAFKKSYVEEMKSAYAANVASMAFDQSQTIDAINQWVKNATEGKIAKIVGEDIASAAVILSNAVYFSGKWRNEFLPENTRKESFSLSAGDSVEAEMMHLTSRYRYLKSDGYEAIELPYWGKTASMVVILPSAGIEMSHFINDLDTYALMQNLGAENLKYGRLAMPKFKLENSVDLKQPLTDMGAEVIFTGSANFDNLSNQRGLRVSKAFQKVFVDVNEKGTEAATATVIEMRFGSAGISEEPAFNMVVNRPYLCLIRHNVTQAILFSGIVFNPKR